VIEEVVTVTAVTDGGVRVAASRRSACAQCASRSSCSQGVLSQWQQDKLVEVDVLNPEQLQVSVGASVLVGLQEGSLMKASFMLYCIPLLLLISSALFVAALGGSEMIQVAVAVAMMLVGFWCVKHYTSRHQVKAHYQPILLKILET